MGPAERADVVVHDRLIHPAVLDLAPPWAERLASSRSMTIAGGTTEVNKNIIGERVLGLPREPRAG